MSVCISPGNKKIKDTLNISLNPRRTCSGFACWKHCYTKTIVARFPVVLKAWDDNLNHFYKDPDSFFVEIMKKLKSREHRGKRTRFFRWHVGGEIPNQRYLDGIIRVAQEFPKTRFLVFTKRYHLDYSNIPENLSVAFSAWPGKRLPNKIRNNFAVVWMDDGKDTRIKKANNPFVCKGNCAMCRICWHMNRLERDVIIPKHK